MNNDDNIIKELEINLYELKKTNDAIQSFMKMRGGGYKNNKNSIEYFINEKKKYNKLIIITIIVIIICVFYLILKKYNNKIINNKLLGGSTTEYMVDNFTLIIRSKIFEFWNNLPKGKILFASVIFILLYTYLASKKQSFMCYGCSKGDWWYRCNNGTGYNSVGCTVYTKVHDIISYIINLGFETVGLIKNIVGSTIKSLNITKNRVKKLIGIIKKVSNINLRVPSIPLPRVTMNCRIPVGKEGVDVCGALATVINTPLQGLKSVLEKGIKVMFDGFSIFWNELKKVANLLIKSIAKAIGYMILPFHILLGLLVDLKKTFEFILYTIRKLGIFNMILYNIANFVKTIFPIRNFGTLIAVTMLVFVVFILFPLIGGIAAGFKVYYNIFTSSYDNLIFVPFEFIGDKMENYEPNNTEVDNEVNNELDN